MSGPVLCATDLSSTAVAATEIAVEIAHASGRVLELLHVAPHAPEIGAAGLSQDVELALLDRIARREKEAAAALEKERARIAPRIATVNTTLISGHPADVIVQRAEELEAALVVVGPHGAASPGSSGVSIAGRDLTEWMIGSTADRVVRYAPCPVLVGSRQPSETGLAGGKWIVPMDRSEHAIAAFGVARELAEAMDAELIAVHVAKDVGGQLDPAALETDASIDRDALRKLALAHGRATVDELALDEPLAEGRLRIGVGPVAPEIVRIAEDEDARLIVMGTRGRSGLKRLVLGSVAERTLRLSPRPVLCVRAR